MQINATPKPQADAYATPWPLRQRLAQLAWQVAWLSLCQWTPKPLNPWRLMVLRLFGATIRGTPFVHQRARIEHPWNLELHHRACVGDRTALYSLARIFLGEGATVAQEAYLCTGTHDFNHPAFALLTSPILVEPLAFVGARAFVMPGVTLGERCVVGAMSVVTRDVAPKATVVGNPARQVGSVLR